MGFIIKFLVSINYTIINQANKKNKIPPVTMKLFGSIALALSVFGMAEAVPRKLNKYHMCRRLDDWNDPWVIAYETDGKLEPWKCAPIMARNKLEAEEKGRRFQSRNPEWASYDLFFHNPEEQQMDWKNILG